MSNDLATPIIEAVTNNQPLNPEDTIESCYEVLKRSGSNIVWEILRQSDKFLQWNHYPKGDVYDKQTHSQYYYHAHEPDDKRLPEHGHFHLFVRKKGMPKHIQPAIITNDTIKPEDQDDICHIIAISMDKKGFPTRLFTTNRWVTGETWYDANATCELVDLFNISHAWPSWPTNLWLNAMVQWFAPEIKQLIQQRDEVVAHWQSEVPDHLIYENRNLEVVTHMDIEIE
ncbi:MAG: hypothetical protein P1U34_00840 [Coxiellaceae bacterium]|nr:hypothetical protein [Coxiellaceae bacterium]